MNEWSASELLDLASAVEEYGSDWEEISDCLEEINDEPRPPDFYSPKNCAERFAELIREQKNLSAKNASTSKLIDDACRRFAKVYGDQIREEIRKSHEREAQLLREADDIRNNRLTPAEVKKIYESEQVRKNELQLHQLLLDKYKRDKESRKREKEKQKQKNAQVLQAGEAKEVTGGGSGVSVPYHSGIQSNNSADDSKVVVKNIQEHPAASPLLTSLLKSPNQNMAQQTVTAATAPAHATAPTITNLLIGGAIHQSHPAITLKSTIAASEAAQLLTRPISGPPCVQVGFGASATAAAQQALSPSQSAPTLSMLLERNKNAAANIATATVTAAAAVSKSLSTASVPKTKNEAKVAAASGDAIKVKQVTDKNMEIETNSTELANAGDEAEVNVDSELMEVFENLGPIDDLAGIDVAAVISDDDEFLKSMEENLNLSSPIDVSAAEQNKSDNGDGKMQEKTQIAVAAEVAVASVAATETEKDKTATAFTAKLVITSSDDSNDNVPLSALNNSGEEKFAEKRSKDADTDADTDTDADADADIKQSLEAVPVQEIVAQALAVEDKTEKQDDNEIAAEAKTTAETSSDLQAENEDIQQPIEATSPTNESYEEAPIATVENNSNEVREELTAEADESQNHNSETEKSPSNVHADAMDVDESVMPYESCAKDAPASNSAMPTAATAPVVISLTETETEDSCASDVPTTIPSSQKLEITVVATRSAQSTPVASKEIQQEPMELDEQQQQQQQQPEQQLQQQQQPAVVRNATPLSGKIMHAKVAPVRRKLRDSVLSAYDDDSNSELSIGQRLRTTRASSTHPASPSPSSEQGDRKQNLLLIFHKIKELKSAIAVRKILKEHKEFIKQNCYSFLDFETIKKNIELCTLSSKTLLKRELMLLAQNCIMSLNSRSDNFKAACDFSKEISDMKDLEEDAVNLPTQLVPVVQLRNDKDGSSTKETKASTVTTKARKKKI